MNRRRSVLVVASSLLLLATGIGCSEDSSEPQVNQFSDIVGSYTLVTIAGNTEGIAKAVPATFETVTGGTMTVASGTLSITSNGSYTIAGPYTTNTGGNFNHNRSGTLTRSGDNLVFSNGTNPFNGAVDGDAISATMAVTPAADLLVLRFDK